MCAINLLFSSLFKLKKYYLAFLIFLYNRNIITQSDAWDPSKFSNFQLNFQYCEPVVHNIWSAIGKITEFSEDR
jgi:hypothetical protein